jgi:hypothetical protein
MSIPITPISIDLEPNIPTPLTPETLQTELNGIGLTCKYTDPRMLAIFINQVDKQIPDGSLQSFKILKPATNSANRIDSFIQNFEVASQGNWTIKDTTYDQVLEYISYPTHFDWIKQNDTSFTGISQTSPSDNIKATTVDAIKQFFVDTLTMASSVVIKGLNKDTLRSVMSNAINQIPDNVKDYDQTDSRTIFLVDNYNPNTKTADAIGVVAVDWHLVIHDYQAKSNQPVLHDTTLTVTARGVQYADLDQMNTNYEKAMAHFGNNSFQLFDIPIPPDNEVTIFTEFPPATVDTFNSSLPLISKSTYIDHMVMYAPDVETIASIDNTSSGSNATYLKSVATGYSFTANQNISITAGFEVTSGFVKGSLSLTFSFGFSEQWSTLTTETINFTVPAGKKAFLYQGTLKSRILRYDPSLNTYTYMEDGMLKTTVFAVSDTPIDPGSKPQIVPLK